MIKDENKITTLIYDILNAVEKTSYKDDRERVRGVLEEYEIIKSNGGLIK